MSQDGAPLALTALTQLRRLTGADDGGDGGLEGAAATPRRGGSTWARWGWLAAAGCGWSRTADPPAAGAGAAHPIETGTPEGLLAAMSEFGRQVPALSGLFGGRRGLRLRIGLADTWPRCSPVLDGDGVVPFLAQFHDLPAALAGTSVDAARHRLPEHPDAVTQTLAQLGTWVPGPQRAVLLIGPPFTGQASWQPLLAAAEAAQPGPPYGCALRPAEPADPSLADLKAFTVAVPWSRRTWPTRGDLAAVVAQVAAVVGRIQELRCGAPVVLVAHFAAGLAARAFAVAIPAQFPG